MSKAEVKPDWRVVKISMKRYCDEAWIAKEKIDECGIFALVDANLHVHICSFTPSLEVWGLIGYVTFTEGRDEEGEKAFEIEQEMLRDSDVEYYGTDLLDKCKHVPATKYVDIPEQEEDEPHDKYRMRVADHVREYLQGNPCWF